jgi:hypothetical protein
MSIGSSKTLLQEMAQLLESDLTEAMNRLEALHTTWLIHRFMKNSNGWKSKSKALTRTCFENVQTIAEAGNIAIGRRRW